MAARKKTPSKPTSSRGKAKGKRATKLAPNAIKRGLSATEVALALDHADIAAVVDLVNKAGGAPLGAYREPLGGRPLLLASLPFSAVQPTPFQRDLSPTHAKRLAGAIEATAAFLDPLIVVRGEDGRFWTPNGRHRLAAAKMLGLKQITVLISPDETLSYRILALNTEKAHNLREKSLEVIRMYREFAELGALGEDACGLEFEEPAFITLGLCYEARPRFSGGAYHPVLKRVDTFLTCSCREALDTRQARAKAVLELDDLILEKVESLKARGLTSPYLKSFVVARVNPIRFRPKDAPSLSFDEAIDRMRNAALKFNADKIRTEDLAKSGGVPDETD